MKTLTTFFSLALFFLFCSCGEDFTTNSSIKIYMYTGYDSSWNKIISGYLWIKSVDSTSVKGSWDFKLICDEENIGPQIGKGVFEGVTDMRGSMSLNLNPGSADNNVILNGNTFLPYRFEGAWHYIGFVGEINWGRFEATQAH
jgi:hypothetical protein